MRYLHAVGPSEKFIASGHYIHYMNGTPTGAVEHWAIHELPDGAQMIRVDDDSRKRDGSSVLIEAWRAPASEGGHIARVDLHAFAGNKDAAIKELRATYNLTSDTRLEVGRSIDDMEREHMIYALPTGGRLLSPEALIFAGFEVDELAVRGGSQNVVSYLPVLINESSYLPVVSRQEAHFVHEEKLLISGREMAARCFDQQHPATGEVTRLWIDAHAVLLQYRSADGRHTANLTDYARRPDPK
ncbi:MAG: hypothetical protein ACOCXZ_01310 [Chloroflexota bacterium]